MSEPRWDDPAFRAGTMVRGALWLLQCVGEGNTFTKQQLRDAFPRISQADRRVRDLRDYGWVLNTNVEDVALLPEEQRFAKRGIDVWDKKLRAAADRDPKAISNKERDETFARYRHQCVVCGIAGGEAYPDRPSETAVLAVSTRVLEQLDGNRQDFRVPECKRCRSGAKTRTFSVPEVRDLLDELDDQDIQKIKRWSAKGVRGTTSIERAWNGLRVLPAVEQSNLLNQLR